MESPADKLRALLYAIGVHVACVLVMFVGLLWTKTTKPVSVAGSVIEATLVSSPSTASSAAKPSPPQPRETAPPPQPKPSPAPQRAVEKPQPAPQAPIPDPDTVEREKAARLAIQQAEEKARQEQEQRRRQAQVELDEKKRQEVEQRERLNQMQQEQAAQLADIRRKREEAEKRRKLEEDKLRQLQDRTTAQRSDAPPAPVADRLGNNGTDESLLGRYQLAIQQAVQREWLRPDSARAGIHCSLRIVQIPGGEVIQVSVTSPCNADDLTRRSIEAAVLKAQPLPYRGYENVFQREIRFNFRYDG